MTKTSHLPIRYLLALLWAHPILHISTIRVKVRQNWIFVGHKAELHIDQMLLLYKGWPIWTYGIELWGCASTSNIAVIQRHQSKLLRTITNAPRYVSNHTLHQDLRVPPARTVFQERTATHRSALDSHPNPLVVPVPLLHPSNNRRLKRRWTFDEPR